MRFGLSVYMLHTCMCICMQTFGFMSAAMHCKAMACNRMRGKELLCVCVCVCMCVVSVCGVCACVSRVCMRVHMFGHHTAEAEVCLHLSQRPYQTSKNSSNRTAKAEVCLHLS